MRITCPNCLAQYEIDGGVLPPEGREVQCSACDTIWFQAAPSRKILKPVPVPAPAWAQPVPSAPPPPPATIPAPPPQAQVPPPAPPEPAAFVAPAPASAAPAPERPRTLDPTISAVLREEAEFEAAQRKRDSAPVETQPDLGLLGGSPWPAFRDPDGSAADLPGGSRGADIAAKESNASFPDIEDVSASLDPISARRQTEGGYDLPQTAKDRQRSFLQGFIVPLALGGLVLGLYLAAPLISALVPPAAPVLTSFVNVIDAGRAALAQMILGR